MQYREAEGESPTEEEARSLMKSMRDQLLLGLSDESEVIRSVRYIAYVVVVTGSVCYDSD